MMSDAVPSLGNFLDVHSRDDRAHRRERFSSLAEIWSIDRSMYLIFLLAIVIVVVVRHYAQQTNDESPSELIWRSLAQQRTYVVNRWHDEVQFSFHHRNQCWKRLIAWKSWWIIATWQRRHFLHPIASNFDSFDFWRSGLTRLDHHFLLPSSAPSNRLRQWHIVVASVPQRRRRENVPMHNDRFIFLSHRAKVNQQLCQESLSRWLHEGAKMWSTNHIKFR